MGRKKKRKKKSRLVRTFNRLFWSTDFGPALFLVVLVSVAALAFSVFTGIWIIFGLFAAGGTIVFGGVVGVVRLQEWLDRRKPQRSHAMAEESPADSTPPAWEPTPTRESHYDELVTDSSSDANRGKSTGMFGHFN